MEILDTIIVLFMIYNVIEAQSHTTSPGEHGTTAALLQQSLLKGYMDLLMGRHDNPEPREDGLPSELSGLHKFESQYYPYWKNGQWVYHRGSSTRIPQAYTIVQGKDVMHPECDQVCTKLYLDYGPICAATLSRNNWNYTYKDFANMCELEFYNCRYLKANYYPLHKGPCVKTKEVQIPTDPRNLLDRAKKLKETFPEDDNFIIPHLLNRLKTSPTPHPTPMLRSRLI